MSDRIVLSWDWRQQPDLDMLASAVREVSEDRCHIRAVDTGSDEYAIVVSADQLSEREANAAYAQHEAGPTAVFAVRCGEPTHPEHGSIYGTCRDAQQLVKLAEGTCYQLVISYDAGETWARAEP